MALSRCGSSGFGFRKFVMRHKSRRKMKYLRNEKIGML